MAKEYNIYYCSDERGLPLMKQSIDSVEKNCNGKYIIHCLTTSVDESKINELREHFSNYYTKVVFYDCTDLFSGKFETYESTATLKHISKTTMLRMYVDKVVKLKKIKKLLYLDNDTYVNKDLSELFETDLTGYYLGAVRDTFIMFSKNFPHHNDEFYIKRILKCNYFNGGVELLNIPEILKDNMFEKLRSVKLKPYMKCTDQDIYNIVFEDKVKFLDLEYNCKWWMNFKKDDMTIIHAAGNKNQLKYLRLLSIGLYKHNTEYEKFDYYKRLNENANSNKKSVEDVMNIYYCTDSNKIDVLRMSIISIINHSNQNFKYVIHCLMYNVDETDCVKIKSLATNNVKIITYESNKILDELGNYDNYTNSNPSISNVTMLRMYVDKIVDLRGIKKILYLDTDTYVNSDLTYLFNINIQGKYIAAVRDIIVLWSGAWDSFSYYDKYRENGNYFNGGVELLNVEEMKKDDKFSELQLCTFGTKEYQLADQDIYNEILGDKVEYLPINFNYKWWLNEWDFNNIQILHFAGCKKKQLIYMNLLVHGLKHVPHRCKWNLKSTNYEYYNNLNNSF